MAAEDNFDIDIYGDGGDEFPPEAYSTAIDGSHLEQVDGSAEEPRESNTADPDLSGDITKPSESDAAPEEQSQDNGIRRIDSTVPSAPKVIQPPKQVPQTQGTKRKGGEIDERDIDPGATTALYVSDLHWWITDDDIRGWANQSQCEDEMDDISFNEHKVNGKSKGQAYVLFSSSQAATAVKKHIESFGEGQQYAKKFAVTFSNPSSNPFKTLPKDGQIRNPPGANNSRPGYSPNPNYTPNFRGRGTAFNSRGGSGVHNNYNRGHYQGNFQGPSMNNFSPMGTMQQNQGFQARGGMMGTMRGSGMGFRGNRGGMMGVPMNMGMGSMGPMGMGVGMPAMRGMGVAGNFNPGFFNQQGIGGYGASDNPHPPKRSRQE